MELLEKAAEILVESGYAFGIELDENINDGDLSVDKLCDSCGGMHGPVVSVEPFADTLEGRRQADAIEDYLIRNDKDSWMASLLASANKCFESEHERRLWQVKTCLGDE